MAEALLLFMTGEMLSKVISLLADEVSLVWGFEGELKRLEKSLEMVRALIYDASAKNKTQLRSVQVWLEKLNDVACEADAVLEEFAYATLRQKVENRKRDKVRALFSSKNHPLLLRQNLSHKIRNVNVSVDEIYAKGTQIGLITELVGRKDAATAKRNERLTHPFLDDDSNIVGRDDDVLNVVSTLCGSDDDDDTNLSVMAIVGIGGQGKTTLAQLVCKHDVVMRHFSEIIWVCVYEDFDVARLLNEMVQSLTGKNPQLSNIQAIINKELGPKLEQRRYLLVLDDVWNEDEDKWGRFKNALLGISAARGSKILVTARNDQVALTMQTYHNYPLKGLFDEESWTMFKQRAFAEGGAVETADLAVIGREIVKRCEGLPLAIKVVGSLMYSKESKNDWLSVQNSRLWNSADKVLQTLKLSYDHLPFSLQKCFSFCSFYPKDKVIEKNELIQSWMALGILDQPPSGSDLEMEDVGEKYFKTLFSSSLLQDAKKDEYDAITSCKMHDIVHELALDMAKKIYSTLESQARVLKDSQVLVLKHVNSLLHLRVLVLVNNKIDELPDSIMKVLHLRYLDVSNTCISELPNSFTKLYNLQTLKLHWLIRVPKNFGNLINLRHLCVNDILKSGDCMLTGIGRLTCLQTLTFFGVNRERGCHIKELGSLKNLRGDFTIFGLEKVQNHEEAQDALLSEKSHLRTLRLRWGTLKQTSSSQQFRGGDNEEYVLEGLEPHSKLEGLAIENFEGTKFPRWMMVESQASRVLGNLVKIQLSNCNECKMLA